MRRLLPWLVGIAVGAAIGVGGTYAAMSASGGEVTACSISHGWVNNAYKTQEAIPNGQSPEGAYDSLTRITDLRNKACQH